MSNEKNMQVVLDTNNGIGTLSISNDVLKEIVALSLNDITGVTLSSLNKTNITKIFNNNVQTKGIEIKVVDDKIDISIEVSIDFGLNIPDISAKIQKKVKASIENMVGLDVNKVDIQVPEVVIEE